MFVVAGFLVPSSGLQQQQLRTAQLASCAAALSLTRGQQQHDGIFTQEARHIWAARLAPGGVFSAGGGQ